MTEVDLRHKLDDRRRNYNPQHQREQNHGQFGPPPMKCFNCNQDGHHWSACRNDPFCYNCRDTGHKSNHCPLKSNKGLHLCAYGMPGQLFYALNLPEPKAEQKKEGEAPIRALISVLECRGTRLRITIELQYLMDSKWNWDVKRVSGSEFQATLPSKLALNVLTKMRRMKFITSDIVAVVEESDMDPDAFQMLQSVWVRAVGIPKVARTEFAVMELAQLVGDPEEVHVPSLQWKTVWVKVACKDPNRIGGTSEVFINKQAGKYHGSSLTS